MLIRQDETRSLDLASLPKPEGQTITQTWSYGGHIHARLRIDLPDYPFGQYRTEWLEDDGKPRGPGWTQTLWTTQTQQPGGGWRPWFQCPNCYSRARVVRWWRGWKCGACHPVRYGSQIEDDIDRATRRAQTIRKRLGSSSDMSADFPTKPYGMRWQSYWKLMDRHHAASEEWAALMMWRIMGRRTRHTGKGDAIDDRKAKPAPPPRPWGKVADYLDDTPRDGNEPPPKWARPDCELRRNAGKPCASKAVPGFTICHRHLQRVRQAESEGI